MTLQAMTREQYVDSLGNSERWRYKQLYPLYQEFNFGAFTIQEYATLMGLTYQRAYIELCELERKGWLFNSYPYRDRNRSLSWWLAPAGKNLVNPVMSLTLDQYEELLKVRVEA